ncbi:LysR family transcriptional regulator ArgP [Oceanidesulfovibrio marinus]|uniref:LysR family transcriptional regulator ArgP n=1 Tax=Oceanidesulfovibrio marinus TaxID=370038 RepID=A0A6P1ZJC5_9BACT|nr:LysR family transcriptional regulator ArgP [Oceanidesulfovibrio marinus]TVM35811.1 LysR family transcriptional regulator ArgP [Oceanidesulfovibrio marinus]
MLDYRLLEALALVVREQGFEKAAETMHLTQSAVSQRIKQLEEQAGQVLVRRTSPPEPTRAGREMLRHYNQVKLLENDLQTTVGLGRDSGPVSLPVAVNADSLDTWFLDAVGPFMRREKVVLDLRVDDQEQTQRMLRDGEVVGCVSVEPRPMQGCRALHLGGMRYRLLASPEFMAEWFPEGLDEKHAEKAPLLTYNRKDNLQVNLLRQAIGVYPEKAPIFYLPSTDGFTRAILSGLGYGSVPDQHSAPHLASGAMVDAAPGCNVDVQLYWHSWNIRSDILERFSADLTDNAAKYLEGQIP